MKTCIYISKKEREKKRQMVDAVSSLSALLSYYYCSMSHYKCSMVSALSLPLCLYCSVLLQVLNGLSSVSTALSLPLCPITNV